MYHKQWSTPSQSPGHSFASSCLTFPAPTRTIRLWPQDQKTLASHDQAIASRAASRTDEETTTLNCNRDKTLVPLRGGIALRLLVAKPFDAPDTCFTTGHEQPLAHPWSQDLYTLPNYPTCITATRMMSHRHQDQINVENASLQMPSQRHDGQDISSTMHLNNSWRGALLPDQGCINKVGLPRNNTRYRCTEWETSLRDASQHRTPPTDPNCDDRARLPPDNSPYHCSECETSLHGPNSHLRRRPLPSVDPQSSPYYDEQELGHESAQELRHTGLMSGVFSNRKVNKPRGLQGIINWPDLGSNQETPGAHNRSKDDTVIALPRWTKLASQNHGIVSRCQSTLSDILAGCDEIASMLPLGYSWKGNLTQQQSSPMLVSNLQTQKLTPLLPQASILNTDRSHPDDPTLPPRCISTNPFYRDNSKMSTSSWYCSHVKAIRLLIEEAMVIRVAIKQVDGYIFLCSTSSCLTARKKHVNEVTNSIELMPSEPMGQEGLKAAVGSAREQVLAGAPQPSRLRTKDHHKLHKSGKGAGSESRNQVRIQRSHDRQDSSGASEPSKRRERKNPIYRSHGLAASWLKNLLNRLPTNCTTQ